ncbi:MAG: hypothetical protein H7210_07555 [Pyrinomonadaceae bacterium]|nr:hypothetical protein [Phycisphaerales bacterium]
MKYLVYCHKTWKMTVKQPYRYFPLRFLEAPGEFKNPALISRRAPQRRCFSSGCLDACDVLISPV